MIVKINKFLVVIYFKKEQHSNLTYLFQITFYFTNFAKENHSWFISGCSFFVKHKRVIHTDILVIGSGVAGFSFAIRMAEKRPDLKITVLTKTHEKESNTSYAQGGVAAVWDNDIDNFKKHIEDTLDAGDGICDEKIVEIVVKEGPESCLLYTSRCV